MKPAKVQPLPAIFSLELRRTLEDEKVRARRNAQAHTKRVAAALERERKFREATAAIADAEFEAADAAARVIEDSDHPVPAQTPSSTVHVTNGKSRARSTS